MSSNRYYAGLIDAQLTVTAGKESAIRVTLTSHDARVGEELIAQFSPVRVTIVKRPGKKDVCTALFTGDCATELLRFAAEHCVLKKDVAVKALQVIEGTATFDDLRNVPTVEEIQDVDLDWASGFFDVRGVVVQPQVADENDTADESEKPTKPAKRRGSVKVVLPKNEKFILPALQKVLSGKVKKSSPCRLVYESKDAIKTFVETVGHHIRVKKTDLETVMA